MSNIHAVLSIATMALVTMAIRFFPFAVFKGKETPKYITYLGKVLPYAIIGMLVVYCLKDTSFLSISRFAPQLIAGVFVAALYAWKKNTLLSIVCGTILYMLLVQKVI